MSSRAIRTSNTVPQIPDKLRGDYAELVQAFRAFQERFDKHVKRDATEKSNAKQRAQSRDNGGGAMADYGSLERSIFGGM